MTECVVNTLLFRTPGNSLGYANMRKNKVSTHVSDAFCRENSERNTDLNGSEQQLLER